MLTNGVTRGIHVTYSETKVAKVVFEGRIISKSSVIKPSLALPTPGSRILESQLVSHPIPSPCTPQSFALTPLRAVL